MGDKIFINNNEYKILRKDKKNYEYFVKSKCLCCKKDFFKKKYKNNKFCSKICYYKNLEQKSLIINVNKLELEIINGSLLSDGCVPLIKRYKNLYFTHSCKFEEYIDFLISNFSFKTYKRKNERKNISYELRTKCSKTWNEFRKKWYPNEKKEVPKDLKITPTTLLHWYIGDGCITKENGIVLCTDSFSKKSLNILEKELKRIGIIVFVNKKSRIIVPNKYVCEFLNYIGQSPVFCYSYKWETHIKESYFDRICVGCGNKFNANYNHHKFCKEKCYKKIYKQKNKERGLIA